MSTILFSILQFPLRLSNVPIIYVCIQLYNDNTNITVEISDKNNISYYLHSFLEILKLVMSGRMGQAIDHTLRSYPGLLENNKNLLFMLKCRQFIEMVNGSDFDVSSTKIRIILLKYVCFFPFYRVIL